MAPKMFQIGSKHDSKMDPDQQKGGPGIHAAQRREQDLRIDDAIPSKRLPL